MHPAFAAHNFFAEIINLVPRLFSTASIFLCSLTLQKLSIYLRKGGWILYPASSLHLMPGYILKTGGLRHT